MTLMDFNSDNDVGNNHDYDVSLVLNLHSDGPWLLRTLISLEAAAVYAQRFDISVELVAVLDRTDHGTEQVLARFSGVGFGSCQLIRVDNGSLGLSRNDGVAVARGRYLLMCDGDDMLSFNSIADMYVQANRAGPDCLIFPEYVFAFGDRYQVGRYFPLDCVTPLAFVAAHPFTSRMLVHHSIPRKYPFVDARLSPGYAYEDWHFNAECVAAGYNVEIARDTILFYRQRPRSLLRKADAVSVLQIPPTRLFQPEIFMRRARSSYKGRDEVPCADVNAMLPGPTLLDRPVIRSFLRDAATIDPQVDIEALRSGWYINNINTEAIAIGRIYYEVCLHVGSGPFDEVFLLPFFGIGGGELFLSQVMHTLAEILPEKRLLVILGESSKGLSLPDPAPAHATVLDLADRTSGVSVGARELITLKLVEAVAPKARLHLRDSIFATAFFRRFAAVLREHACIFYRFSDPQRIDNGEMMPSVGGFAFLSDHASEMSAIVTDNDGLSMRDQARIGLFPEKFYALPMPRKPMVTETDISVRTARPGMRVLWASRLAPEKRPELLTLIARRLAQLRPGATIEAFGQPDLDRIDVAEDSDIPSLVFRGAYAGFEQIDHALYDVFLYTSWSDGMPNVLLEAISVGLPVVAMNVGAAGEIVENNISGLLLPLIVDNEAAAAAYAWALKGLLEDSDLRHRLALRALARLRDRHAPERHAARLRAILAAGQL